MSKYVFNCANWECSAIQIFWHIRQRATVVENANKLYVALRLYPIYPNGKAMCTLFIAKYSSHPHPLSTTPPTKTDEVIPFEFVNSII